MNLKSERLVPDKKDSFYLEHIQRYRFTSKYIKANHVLDLGCGAGYGSLELVKYGAKKVIGVDTNHKEIDYAIRKFKNKNLKFKVNNAEQLEFKNETFDTVVSFEVIEHVKNFKKFIKEAFRVLKKGGYFIFSTPNAKMHRGGTSPYHTKEFSVKELVEIFPSVKLYGQFFENSEFVKSEKEYFQRYNKLTIGGNKSIKKLFHLIPSELKSFIYRLFWNPTPAIHENEIVIKKGNFERAVTLIGVVQKKS